jgi:hypothetical protein
LMGYFEADHEELNGLLHLRDFHGHQLGYGDLPIFGLADVEADVGVVIEVVDLLVVDLVEGDKEACIGFLGGHVHDHLEGAREYAAFLTGEEVDEVLLALVGGVVADDGVGLAGAGLSVGEDGGVDAPEELADGVLDQVEDVLLCGLGGQDVVELHVGVVARPADLQRVVLDGAGGTSSRLTNIEGSSSFSTGRIRIIIFSFSSLPTAAGASLVGVRAFIQKLYTLIKA